MEREQLQCAKISAILEAYGREFAIETLRMRRFSQLSVNLSPRLPLRWVIATILAAIAGLAAGRTFLGSLCLVSGSSMAPTYQSGAWVYTAPISSPLVRGDVVIVDDGNHDYAVKRIVGMPGETIHLWRGYVFINRKILLEPYVPKKVYTFPTQRQSVFVLGEEQYFVLGDNRPSSADSRIYGPVERSRIKRRIELAEGALRAHYGPVTIPNFE
jgi:signal peptidase I